MEAVVLDAMTTDVILLGLDFLEEHYCTIAVGHKLFTLSDGIVCGIGLFQ